MPRCCTPIPDEFTPSYASVLVGDLQSKITAIEASPLSPCLTAWCQGCSRPYLLTTSLHLFPRPSAHHAHMVALAERIREAR